MAHIYRLCSGHSIVVLERHHALIWKSVGTRSGAVPLGAAREIGCTVLSMRTSLVGRVYPILLMQGIVLGRLVTRVCVGTEAGHR